MESTVIMKPVPVKKEEIRSLVFPLVDVITSNPKKKIRRISLNQAALLGNNLKYKVKIVFEDNEQMKSVNTTVWAVTEKMIILKSGILIPIHRIHSVKYF